MRTRTIITLAAGAIALTLMLPTQSTQATPTPAGIAQATQNAGLVEDAAYVCRRHWNGRHWVRRCFWVGPHRYYPPARRHYRHYRHYR